MRTEVSSGRSTGPPRPMETERAEGTRAGTCHARLAMSLPFKGANRRTAVNHLRRRTRFNGLGPGFGQCLKTRAQPPSADPHARWCGRGSGATRTPIPILGSARIVVASCAFPLHFLLPPIRAIRFTILRLQAGRNTRTKALPELPQFDWLVLRAGLRRRCKPYQ